MSRSPQQDPVGALVQDRCMRISCARCLCQDLLTCARYLYASLFCISLCQDLCIRIFYDHLCKISVCGSLVQDLSGCLQQDPVGPLVQDRCTRTSCARSLFQGSCIRISAGPPLRRPACKSHNRNFAGIPHDGHAPSPQRVALRNQNKQLYQHFV